MTNYPTTPIDRTPTFGPVVKQNDKKSFLYYLTFKAQPVMMRRMEHFLTFTNETARELGIHFEWAGGSALTVRVVSEFDGNDCDVFTMGGADSVTADQVAAACESWMEDKMAAMNEDFEVILDSLFPA